MKRSTISSIIFVFFLSWISTADQTSSSTIPPKREFPINHSVSPCDNFYEYACSKAVESFKLREDRSYHAFAFNDSSERILTARTNFIKDLNKKKSLNVKEANIRSLYMACMNVDQRKKDETNFAISRLRQVREIKKFEDFQSYLGSQLKAGDGFSIFDFDTIPNMETPSKLDILLLSNLLTLPERTYYDKDETVLDLVQLIKAFFDALSEPNSQTRAESVVGFQKDLSKTHLLPVELRDRLSMKRELDIKAALKRWPKLGLKTFFDSVPEKTIFRDLSPENFDWIQKSFESVPLEVWKDAYLFRILSSYMDDAYPDFQKKYFEFEAKHLGGPSARPSREERCTRYIISLYGMELDHELAPKLFPKFEDKKVVSVAEKVRQSIINSLSANEWLSEKAKQTATEKMKTAKLFLVKPQKTADWNFNLPAKYDTKHHLANISTLLRNNQKKALSKLKVPRNPNEWSFSPLTVNAYYSPADNKFVLLLGILQYPFFDGEQGSAFNFGAMGSVVGHELGHGIDDKGSKYDAQGKLNQWMTDSDLATFTKKSAKIVEQLNDHDVPGELKLGEFIGDLTGATLSYDALIQSEPSSNPRDFFLGYARLWCYVARPSFMEMLAKTDPHPSGEIRVNEVLKHVPEFQKAYSCKKGDKMFLAEKDRVKIW